MVRVLRFVDDKFEEILGVLALTVVVSLIFVGVVVRLTVSSGIPWQEELSRILYVVVVYLGASYGVKSRDHIRVTILAEYLPPRGRRVLAAATDVVWIVFNLVVAKLAIDVFRSMSRFSGRSAVLDIPLQYIFLVVPFAFVLISFRLVQRWFRPPPAPAAPDTLP